MNKIKLTDHIEKEIVKLNKEGYSQRYISTVLNISKGSVWNVLNRLDNYCNKFKPIHNINTLYPLDKYKVWFLGLLYGDGHIKKIDNTIEFVTSDIDFIENINNIFECKFNIYEPKLNNYRISINSKDLVKEINTIFEIPRGKKSNILKYPNKILISNLNNHFIRGIIDTDGSWYLMQGKYLRFKLQMNSYDLIKTIAELLKKELNIDLNIHISKYNYNKNNKYSLSYSIQTCKKEYVKKIINYLYYNSDSKCRNLRKYDIISSYL